MGKAELNAGIIGLGRIGTVQAKAIKSLGYARVSAILTRNPGAAGTRPPLPAAEGVKIFTDIEAFLADPDIDVVHICTPNPLHYKAARACLLSGRPVLCEKPLTIDSAHSAELVEIAARRSLPTAVNFVYRHYPTLGTFKAMLDSGELGRVHSVRGGFLQGLLLDPTIWDWRIDSRLGGPSRAMADIGTHWCDLARYLLGREITEICADFAIFIPERPVPEEAGTLHAVDTEDQVSALLRFSDNVRGSFTASQVTAGAKSAFSIAIDGSLASIRWDREKSDMLAVGRLGRNDQPPEEIRDGTGPAPDWESFRAEAQRRLIDSFYRQILDGKRGTHADFSDGHAIAKVVEAAIESARSRHWVSLSVQSTSPASSD